MSFQRIVGHALIVCYLIVVVLGAVQAVKRSETVDMMPLGRVTMFMYGMLAPYQGYSRTAEGFVAEGYAGGAWHPIDLAPYYPVLPGERAMREWHVYHNWANFPSDDAAHRAYAETLLSLEAAAGRPYERVRLSWIQWRPAPASYRMPAAEPLLVRSLVTVP